MPPSVGASPGTSVAAAAHISAPKPSPMPAKAAPSALRAARRLRSTANRSEDGDGEADHLADREPAGGGSVDRLARHGDVDAGSMEAGGGVLEPVASAGVEIGRGLVVADRGEGGAAVVGEPAGRVEGVLDRRDVRLSGDLGERGLDVALGPGPLERAVAGAEDDDGLRARLGLEALLEEVLGLLGLDARDGEVVLEAAADGDGPADQRGHGEQHGEGGGARAAADEGCDVGEEIAHGPGRYIDSV